MESIQLLQEYPYRTPIDMVKSILDIIENKTICDIGCGSGDILYIMKKIGKVKSVIGFECYKPFVELAEKNNRDYITCANVTQIDIPDCDVFFMWTGDELMNQIIKKIKSNRIVICGTGTHKFNPLENNPLLNLVEKRTYTFNETNYCKNRVKDWDYTGHRNLWIFKTK